MIELKEHKSEKPICPHCDHPIADLWFQELKGFFGRRYLYFCSHCRKVLGISHRKGNIMG